MQRRHFLKSLASTSVMPLLATPGLAATRKSRGANPKKLLVIFQRGGNDTLNTLVPVDATQYGLYQALRPDLALPQGSLLNLPGSGFFGLHPALEPMQNLINAGQVTFLNAVGYPGPDRSHFESQAYYETGVPGNGLLDGWINRFLATTTGAAPIRGVAVGWTIPQAVRGTVNVPVSLNFGQTQIDIDGALSDPDDAAYRSALQQLINQTATPGNEIIYDTARNIYQMIDSFADRDLESYNPSNNADYPDTLFGSSIKHCAQMLKDDVSNLGIEIAVVDQAGYDTHANQITAGNPLSEGENQHATLLRELARGIQAFSDDMGAVRMADTLILVVSEFGRRAYQNDSFGSDHGTGGLAMVIGPSVNGQVYGGDGDWPGLATADLYQEDDLNWTTDFRDIYWEILARHMGVDNTALAQILPGHGYSALNFI